MMMVTIKKEKTMGGGEGCWKTNQVGMLWCCGYSSSKNNHNDLIPN
jgi:hypothetical protein